ncbi:O-antigen ligase family protein [bacterium]|nr:O-antigen ligase family protein [bacterium]
MIVISAIILLYLKNYEWALGMISLIVLCVFMVLPGEYRVFLLVLLLPLMEGSGNRGVDYLKYSIFGILLVITFLMAIYSDLKNSNLKAYLTPVTLSAFCYICWQGLSIIYSPDTGRAVIDLFRIGMFFILFMIIYRNIEVYRDLLKLIGALFILATVFSIIGLFQSQLSASALLTESRVEGYFVDPNIFARFLSLNLLLGMVLFLNSSKKSIKILLLSIMLLWAMAFSLTFSRSSLLTFIIVLFIFTFYLNKKYLKYIVPIPIALLAFVLTSEYFMERLKLLRTYKLSYSLQFRVNMIRTGWEMIKSNFLFGIGEGGFAKNYFIYKWGGDPGLVKISHNWIITVLAELGIIGFVLILWFLIKAFVVIKKGIIETRRSDYRNIQVAFFCCFLVFVIHGLFYHIFTIQPYFWVFLGLGLGMIKVIHGENQQSLALSE